MALSNWDTLAFDHQGKPSNGEFVNPEGNTVDIYKNWAHVGAPKMWQQEGCMYIEPIIAGINAGDLRIAGFEINASRGPQNGLFIVLEYGPYDARMVGGGIGCSGYEGPEDLLKRMGVAFDPAHEFYSSSTSREDGGWDHHICNMTTNEQIPTTLETEFVGVLPETLQEFFKWAKTLDSRHVQEWIVLCESNQALSFNQGNAYFAERLGVELSMNAPGEAIPPLMEQLLKQEPKPL